MAMDRLERRIKLAIGALFLFFIVLVALSIYLAPVDSAQNTAQLTVSYEAIGTQLSDQVRVQFTSESGETQQDQYLPWTRTLMLSQQRGGTRLTLTIDQGSAAATYTCRITVDGALVAAQTSTPGQKGVVCQATVG